MDIIKIRKDKKYKDFLRRVLQRDFPEVEPRIFKLNITNICNYRCIMCPYSKIIRPKGFMDIGLVKIITDRDIKKGQYLELFNFGEPFLHPKIESIVEILSKKEVSILVSTNGSTGKEKLEKLLQYPKLKIQVALETLDEELYSKITGGGILSKVLKFLDFSKKYRSSFEQVEILVVETKVNKNSIDRIKEYFSGDFPVIRRISDSFGGTIEKDLVLQNTLDKPVTRKPCIFPFLNCVVEWDGLVGWCCYDYNLEVPYGSLYENSLVELFNKEIWKMMRREQSELNFRMFKRCERCDGWRDVFFDDKGFFRLISEDEKYLYYLKEKK